MTEAVVRMKSASLEQTMAFSPLRKHQVLGVMVVILLVATAVRTATFGRIPPGLYHDEAYNGLDALKVLDGDLSLFFSANNGREPAFIYLIGISVAMLGRSPFGVRFAALVPGLLTIAVTFAMVRALFSRRVGLLSAAVLSVTLWHIHLSRVGFRAVLLPLFVALVVWQAALGWRTGRRRYWLVAGAAYGLSFYTYMAARFTPIALGLFALYLLVTLPALRSPRRWRPLIWFGLATLVALAPLAVFTAMHPDLILSRPGQVSIWSPEINGGDFWGTLARHTTRTLGMFFVKGDRIWRHNVPWRPVFDPALGICFLLGLLHALRRFRRDARMAFAVIWTASMALPTLLAEDAPHFLRAVGVLPVVVLFPALGIDWLIGVVSRVWGRSRGGERSTLIVTGCLSLAILGVALFSTASAYFGDYAQDETTAYWFEDGAEALAGDINRFLGVGWDGERTLHGGVADGRVAYLETGLWEEWASVRFLVSESRAVDLLPDDKAWPTLSGAPASIFVWPFGEWRRVWDMLDHPVDIRAVDGALSQGDRDPEPYTTFRAFYVSPVENVPQPWARFQNGIELAAVSAEAIEEGLRVELQWHPTLSVTDDYTVFVHYMRDGQRIGQGDGQPATGLFPTSRWRPGDLIHDPHVIELSTPSDTSLDYLLIGLYRPQDGQRLELLDDAGNPAGTFLTVPVNKVMP
jgi:4-amino-4-deoxy-L-arabinose transferase-like glycosyltransferase